MKNNLSLTHRANSRAGKNTWSHLKKGLAIAMLSAIATPAMAAIAPYCALTCFSQTNGVEPITLVQFAGINQTTPNTILPANNAAQHLDYTAVIGNVVVGNAYTITLKGNTNGTWTNRFRVFIDFNNNGLFTDGGESFLIGSITTSTGIDAVVLTGSITIPAGTTAGNKRMRVLKKFSSDPTDPCQVGASTWGQGQDYTLVVALPCTNPTAATITQGASTTRCSNGTATTLAVTGTLNSATNWQWYTGSCGGTSAGSGTSISVSPTSTTTYYVRGEGGCVTPGTCSNITVNVTQAAAITVQPATTLNVCAGNTLGLSVTATNAATYQWYGPAGIIAGATTANLSIPNATTAMSGNYYVVVGGATPCGTVQSSNAIVTVNLPVSISNQPIGQTLCEGSQISLLVAASNTTGYQWNNAGGVVNNGGNISGATTMNLVIDPSTVANANTYYVALAGLPGCPAVNSSSVPVTINPAVVVQTAPPTVIGVCDGANINLNVLATNATGYAWSKDGTPLADGGNIGGSQTANLTVTNSSATDAGAYTLTLSATTPCPSVTVTTTVTNDHPAAITTQPVNPNSCHGTQGNLSVVATGANLTYQWYEGATALTNTAPYSGTTTPALAISDVTGLNNLDYSVVVTGSCGSAVTSDVVTLTENFNNTWTGTVSDSWSNTSNWSCGILPTSVTNAVVPDMANDPIVDIPTAVCKDLMIDLNAAVSFNGANNKLAIHGNVINNGSLNGTGGTGSTIELAGIAQAISGSTLFNNLEVTGGGVKTLGGNTVVAGILNLNNGLIELGNNSLVLSQPTAQIGGSPTSYIVTNGTGTVGGANMGVGGNPDAVTFHVGIDNTSYTPIMLENLGTADGFQVRVVQDVYADGIGTDPALVTNPVINRTWMVSESVTGGSIVNMTPMWNSPTNEINGFVQTHVFVAHYWNNEWISYVDSANGALAAVAGPFPGMWMTTQDSINNFSPFTVASSGQFPLAIRLNSIAAANVGPRNKVQWTSATEDKGDMYVLESSADGRNFAKIATVAANGKASAYTHWDESPVQGVNYYRVKMQDATGKFSYSKVVTATVKGANGFNIEAYPNPVSSTVSIKVNGVVTGKANVTITDITGKLVKEKVQVTENTATINVSNLASGAYMINYSDDVRHESIKISKQ